MKEHIITFIRAIEHNLHPMHLYCRICERKGEKWAKRICVPYQFYIYDRFLCPPLKWMFNLMQKRGEVTDAKKKQKKDEAA